MRKTIKEAEKNGKALITLFKEQDENTQKKVQLAHTVLLLQFSLLPILVKEKKVKPSKI